MPHTRKPIDFYFDFSSPYGYIAAGQIDALAAKHGRDVCWRPILLGVVFKTTGQSPLAGQPLRGPYHLRDFARSARRAKLPFSLPAQFPFSSLAAARAFYWLFDRDPELARRFARRVYDAAFAKQADVVTVDGIVAVAERLGVDGPTLRTALSDPEVKDRLRTETEAAISRGVFGSPFIIVDGEPFWGSDRLDQVDQWLATGGW